MSSFSSGLTNRSSSPRPRRRQRRPPSSPSQMMRLSTVQLFSLLLLCLFCIHVSITVRYWWELILPSSGRSPSTTGDTSSSQANHYRDGTFNGAPLRLTTVPVTAGKTATTHIHCVGDNYHESSWKQRSCHFTGGLFCYNVTLHKFVIFQSSTEQSLTRVLQQGMTLGRPFHSSSLVSDVASNQSQTVSLGGINQKWGKTGIQRLEWFPEIINLTTTATLSPHLVYYALPPSIVLLPYHSLNGANPGHAVWDDFMSLYTLMDMFDLLHLQPLLMRYVLDDGQARGLWASCDWRANKTTACAHILNKFGPLMMKSGTGYHWSTTQEPDFQPNHAHPPPTDLVCASHGAAGIGALTDHGVIKSHGWEEEDFEITHNHGRGGLVRRFRQYVMDNVGLGQYAEVPQTPPHRVVVSQGSSSTPARNLKLEIEIDILRAHVKNAIVEPYVFKDMSLTDQLRIAGQTAVFISLCGGGAVTGMFLPNGASVILFYYNGGIKHNKLTGKPAMLDWDLFSAMSHLRVHWIPISTRESYVGQAGLVGLVKHELFLIENMVP